PEHARARVSACSNRDDPADDFLRAPSGAGGAAHAQRSRAVAAGNVTRRTATAPAHGAVTETNASTETRLTLISRVDCSHCEDARRDLQRLGAEFYCLDVDEDAELLRRYNEWVPVLLLDGAELARAPLSEQTLRLAVDLSRAQP